jgi:hypothetical protein
MGMWPGKPHIMLFCPGRLVDCPIQKEKEDINGYSPISTFPAYGVHVVLVV